MFIHIGDAPPAESHSGGSDAGPKTCAKKLTPSDFFNPHRLPFKHKIRWLYISAWLKEAWQCHDTYESRTIIFSL